MKSQERARTNEEEKKKKKWIKKSDRERSTQKLEDSDRGITRREGQKKICEKKLRNIRR